MTPAPLRAEQHGPVRWLWLNRPEHRNALNGDLIDALSAQVDEITTDPDTTVVVVAGEGPSFGAGGDFRHFLELDAADERGVVTFLSRLSDVFTRIEQCPKPWVAAIHGHAIAGGLELALVCDVVIAAEGTWIGDGHVLRKLLPGGGSSVRLERAVGRTTARWMHLSGQPVRAEDLRQTGWLLDVVPPERLTERAAEVAATLAAVDTATQQRLKTLLTTIYDIDEPDALRSELDAFQINWEHGAAPEALRAFLDTRSSVGH